MASNNDIVREHWRETLLRDAALKTRNGTQRHTKTISKYIQDVQDEYKMPYGRRPGWAQAWGRAVPGRYVWYTRERREGPSKGQGAPLNGSALNVRDGSIQFDMC